MAKPTAVKNIINELIKNLNCAGSSNRQNITRALNKTLDKKTLKHIKIGHYNKNNKLVVYVDSSVWLYNLNLQTEKILKRVNKELPEAGVKKLVFKIGRV